MDLGLALGRARNALGKVLRQWSYTYQLLQHTLVERALEFPAGHVFLGGQSLVVYAPGCSSPGIPSGRPIPCRTFRQSSGS